ncbi:MAG: SDR family NAD(P)-dependent oxidoreductase, partial [Paracoccaceae bacterium]
MTRQGKRLALVTGSARGIGLATAEKFLAEGWRVVLLDIDAETLAATHARLALPDDTMAVACDVAEPDQVTAAVDAVVARFGRIDALVNNAGVADFRPILETDFAVWSRILAVNLTGPFLCTQACAPVMLAGGGGAVVNIASISGFRASTL